VGRMTVEDLINMPRYPQCIGVDEWEIILVAEDKGEAFIGGNVVAKWSKPLEYCIMTHPSSEIFKQIKHILAHYD